METHGFHQTDMMDEQFNAVENLKCSRQKIMSDCFNDCFFSVQPHLLIWASFIVTKVEWFCHFCLLTWGCGIDVDFFYWPFPSVPFVWIIFPIQLSPLAPRLSLSISFCYTLSQSATSLSLSYSFNITWHPCLIHNQFSPASANICHSIFTFLLNNHSTYNCIKETVCGISGDLLAEMWKLCFH